jgi:hypothetical protein
MNTNKRKFYRFFEAGRKSQQDRQVDYYNIADVKST